ncbi:MAG: methyltransferase [Pelagibacterium sp. SCN 64-44]|nr:MAG: methyltransferase [Pelagibacterium sp. SCN 64-44]
MKSITAENTAQYSDSRKLAARARLASEYTINETPWFQWVAQQLPVKANDRILDVGCGPAWFWEHAAGSYPDRLDLTLTDMSQGMVDEALARCRGLKFASVQGRQTDASALPFNEETFDAVIAMHMLYHVPDPAVAIAEMHRVLRPGGFLAVTTNGAGNMRELYELTTAFGSGPSDPAATVFGFDAAERLLSERFGNVSLMQHPARMRVTDPEDVFLALTSYPPGDSASEEQLAAFRAAIELAFSKSNGVLEVGKETGLFISRKAA